MDFARNEERSGTAGTEAGGSGMLDLQQLQSAVAEISRVLNAALRDERNDAVNHLRRAECSLKARIELASSRAAPAGPRLAAWQVRRVKEYIDLRLETPIRNRDLAALVDLSEFHFAVAFRNSVGHSPHEYVIRRRVARAQALMLSTDKPLCDVAFECGLADQAHLSRLFRKVIGESPAMWRRAARAPA
jgi:AraC family transcriptional regulator